MDSNSNLTWREAIIEVLKTSGAAMHYTDIAEEILKRGLRKEVGATPAATVGAQIYSSLKKHKESSPFAKTDKTGVFRLNFQTSTIAPPKAEAPDALDEDEADKELQKDEGIIRALGMFWRRDYVDWKSPKLWGKWLPEASQASSASKVDFFKQRGVYILHDGNETVYVGRACPGELGTRLLAHTTDRLNGRWDRFSWFGLLRVKSNGGLEEWESAKFTQNIIAITLEALLIEGLEPKQNRKRGEADFKAIEYIQVEDPNLEEKKMQEIVFTRLLGGKGNK